jgi:ferric-dicitrate binding protein FerR (iron transport regulator)
VLSDGTVVWLNGESKLYYPSTFSGSTREVTLEGEAFFEVAKDSLKPFLIEAQQSLTQVLGTSFNVRAYEGEETVEVAVLTGKVAFKAQEVESSQTLLLPGCSGIYHKSGNRVKKVKNEDENFLSWKTGTLTFGRTPLAKVAADLSRHYKKEIRIEDATISTLQITTSFSGQTLLQVLDEISLLLNISYQIEGDQVIFKAKAK